jgi:hypothetical protein
MEDLLTWGRPIHRPLLVLPIVNHGILNHCVDYLEGVPASLDEEFGAGAPENTRFASMPLSSRTFVLRAWKYGSISHPPSAPNKSPIFENGAAAGCQRNG